MRTTFRTAAAAVGAGTLALALAACGGTATSSETTTAATAEAAAPTAAATTATEAPVEVTDVNLRLDFIPTGKDAIWTYGIEQGFFEQAGINLSVEPGKGSAVTAGTVSNGADDFGLADGGTWLSVASAGAPGKAVMAVFQTGSFAILSPEASPITAIGDLVGKTVAITNGDAPSGLLKALLTMNNVPVDEVKLVNMPPPAKLGALATGKVDSVATSTLVQAGLAAKGTPTSALTYAQAGLEAPGWYLLTNEDMLANQPDVVARFVAAAQQSVEATLANPQAAVDSFVKAYPEVDPAVSLSELEAVIPLVKSGPGSAENPTGWISPEFADSTLQLLAKNNGFEASKPASDFITNEFVK